ncbi:hypothetical protein LV779_24760 [Streptomyces thinghirensis]|nr:hypothetical protein [Streptomyces thinghirensis]
MRHNGRATIVDVADDGGGERHHRCPMCSAAAGRCRPPPAPGWRGGRTAPGYQADPSARGLRTQRTRLLGLVVLGHHQPLQRRTGRRSAGGGAGRGLPDGGVRDLKEPSRVRAVMRQLTARRIDGLVLGRHPTDEGVLDALLATGAPVVWLGGRLDAGPGDACTPPRPRACGTWYGTLVRDRGLPADRPIGGAPRRTGRRSSSRLPGES